MANYPQIQALVQEAGENFPVASWLLPQQARRAVLHFYSFARHADNIADHPTIPAKEKQALLSHLQQAVLHGHAGIAPEWARDYIRDTQAGISHPQHGVDLLTAFIQDARQNRMLSMDELLRYCRYSAAPVGRVVLESSGEDSADTEAADALCSVLQLINHLQDCKKDYQQLNRIYLPKDWMQQHRVAETALDAPYSSAALQAVFTKYLDTCTSLLVQARRLPRSIRSRRLRLELAIILEIADHLVRRLEQRDVLKEAVRLSYWQWPLVCIRSVRWL